MAGKQRGRRGASVEQWRMMFGAQVRLKRVQLGFRTQQALADYVGFATHGSISQIEMGNIAPHFDVACQLASFLGISLDAIIGLSVPEPAGHEWYRDMLMVRLPAAVQELWSPGAQQEILTRAMEAMAQAMRETMAGPAPLAGPAPDPEDGTVPAPGVRPLRATGTPAP